MLGAFTGDALGSFLEFTKGAVKSKTVAKAMTMPGGGFWNTKPGQVTDDSELAMCQLRGLLAGEGKFDLFHHCLYYRQWLADGPFDIGETTQAGLGPLLEHDEPNPAACVEAAATGERSTSLSNGSLMRITPLAVWA